MNEIIPKYIEKRNIKLIQNKYHFIDLQYEDEFHLVIYYLEKNKCKIIIRRLDEETGWGQRLKLKIYSNDQNEIIQIGSSDSNCLQLEYELKFINITPKIEQEQLIPKRIIQTSFDNKIKSLSHLNAFMSFIELNPEYDYEFYTDIDCREFISRYFDERVLRAYDMIIPKAFKSDLFRICYIYIKGGCYFDNKHILKIPLSEIINPNDTNIYCKDLPDKMMHNGIFFSIPNTKNLIDCINNMVNKIDAKFMHGSPLSITGPSQFYLFTHDQNVFLKLIKDNSLCYLKNEHVIGNNNKIVVYRRYKGYYNGHRKENYDKLFKNKFLYYENYQKIDDQTIIMSYPSVYKNYIKPNCRLKRVRELNSTFNLELYQDKFKFIKIETNKLFIQRIDADSGWNINLKLLVINTFNHQTYSIDVGSSDHNIKFISL